MKNQNIKNKIINHLFVNGKKETGENILLKSFKKLQKSSTKQSKKLIQLVIIFSMPIFKIHKITIKKKKKKIQEIPVFLKNKKTRISLGIKYILTTLKNKSSDPLYIKLYKEILLNLKNEGAVIQIKNKIQKQALLRKNFSYYYR